MYKPSHIANFMLDHAFSEGRPISPMKLIKLVYIAYGWGLAALNTKFFDEPIYAWQHGPVVESLYHEFKTFGASAITNYSVILDLGSNGIVEPRINGRDKEAKFVLGIVWDVYKRYAATDLSDKTHEHGTPWHKVYEPGVQNIRIPDNIIKEHYISKIEEYLNHADGRTPREGEQG